MFFVNPDQDWEWYVNMAVEKVRSKGKKGRPEYNPYQKGLSWNSGNRGKGKGKTSYGECFNCGLFGHWASQCYKNNKGQKGGGKSKGKSGSSDNRKGKTGKNVNVTDNGDGAPEEGVSQRTNVLYIKEYEHCLTVDSKHKDRFGGVIDTGFNGVALASTKWLAAYENFLRQQNVVEKKLSRRDAYVQRFVFGNGNWKESSQIVELPVYFGGKYHKVQCRLIEGSTELLLGRIWCEDNDVVIRAKNNEIQFGKSGCWEKLLVNNKGHLVLPLDPALWYCSSVSKGRTSRRRKREKRMLRDFRNKEMIDSSDILGAEESMNLLAQDRVQDLKRIDVFYCEISRQIEALKEDFKKNKKIKKKKGHILRMKVVVPE